MLSHIRWRKKALEKNSDWKIDLNDQINSFRPDLLAISSTEDMWELGMRVLTEIKNYKKENNIL